MTYPAEEISSMESLIGRLEHLYNPLMDAKEYAIEGIQEILSSTFSHINTFEDKEELYKLMASNSFPMMHKFSYITQRAYFLDLQLVIFDKFPNIQDVSWFVFKFTKMIFTTKLVEADINKFISLLVYIEENAAEHLFGNHFRLLKLIVTMVFYRSFVNVSILSNFILHQIYLSDKPQA